MDSIPNELIILIFDLILLITDKRQFLKTCLHYNKLLKQTFLQYEQNYKIKNLLPLSAELLLFGSRLTFLFYVR